MNKVSFHSSQVFEERVRALLKDDYVIVHRSMFAHLWYVKLRHRFNSNVIIVQYDVHCGVLTQTTNGKEVHREVFD